MSTGICHRRMLLQNKHIRNTAGFRVNYQNGDILLSLVWNQDAESDTTVYWLVCKQQVVLQGRLARARGRWRTSEEHSGRGKQKQILHRGGKTQVSQKMKSKLKAAEKQAAAENGSHWLPNCTETIQQWSGALTRLIQWKWLMMKISESYWLLLSQTRGRRKRLKRTKL